MRFIKLAFLSILAGVFFTACAAPRYYIDAEWKSMPKPTTAFMPAEDVSRMTLGLMIDRLESQGKWKIDLDLSKLLAGEWGRVIEVRSAYLRDARTVLLKDL